MPCSNLAMWPVSEDGGLNMGWCGPSSGSSFSISAGARVQGSGEKPNFSIGTISAGATITFVGQTPPASTGNISAGAQITFNGFVVTSGSGNISAGANIAGDGLVQRQGTFDISAPATITLIGAAPVLPNLPTKWVYICPDPVIMVYPGNVYDPCAVPVETPPSFLTSPLYPVQFIDEMAASGSVTRMRVLPASIDNMTTTADVTGIQLRTPLLTYDDWPPEEITASGEFTGIQLRQILKGYEIPPEEITASAEFTGIFLKRILITYPNWPLLHEQESMEAQATVTGISLT